MYIETQEMNLLEHTSRWPDVQLDTCTDFHLMHLLGKTVLFVSFLHLRVQYEELWDSVSRRQRTLILSPGNTKAGAAAWTSRGWMTTTINSEHVITTDKQTAYRLRSTKMY
jgi:hypothetical protein